MTYIDLTSELVERTLVFDRTSESIWEWVVITLIQFEMQARMGMWG